MNVYLRSLRLVFYIGIGKKVIKRKLTGYLGYLRLVFYIGVGKMLLKVI